MGHNESQVSHTTAGQERPEVSVATWGSGEPGPVDGQPRTSLPMPRRLFGPLTPEQTRFNRQLKVFPSDLDYGAHVNQTGLKYLHPKKAKPKAPALPVILEVYSEEEDVELEESPPPENLPPPAASPAAAVEPGLAPEETEAPPPLDEEPSMEPMLDLASEEELPLEGPAQGPLVECDQPVPRDNLVFFLFFSLFILFICVPCHGSIFSLLMFIAWGFIAFIILSFLSLSLFFPLYNLF
nr:hypothetical protein mPipKuh1_008219 [Pipistrellus kuhlii]